LAAYAAKPGRLTSLARLGVSIAFCCGEILFVTQRHDGIKSGGFVRRIEAKEDAND